MLPEYLQFQIKNCCYTLENIIQTVFSFIIFFGVGGGFSHAYLDI